MQFTCIIHAVYMHACQQPLCVFTFGVLVDVTVHLGHRQ